MRTIALKMAGFLKGEGKYPWLSRTVQLLITVGLIYFVANRLIREETQLLKQFSTLPPEALIGILLVILLMPVNLILESAKWQWMIRSYYPEISVWKAFQALLAGMTTGIFTPNRVGEYVGRLMYLPAGARTEAGVYMLWERFFQMMITSWMGSLGLWLLLRSSEFMSVSLPTWLSGSAVGWGMLVVNALLPVLLLQPARVSRWMKKLRIPGIFFQRMTDSLADLNRKLLLKVIGLGILRYLVFSSQYLILLYAFGYDGSVIIGAAMIWLIFLLKSLIPFIALTELGIRESIAMLIMAPFGVTAFEAFSSTFVLYLINVIIPALVGLIFVYRIRWQK